MRTTCLSCRTLVVVFGLLLSLVTDAWAGLFQNMRVAAGSYPIRVSTGSRVRRAYIPAFCINEKLATPSRSDNFGSASKSMKLVGIRGGTKVSEIPLEQAIHDGIIRLPGSDDFRGVEAELMKPEAGVDYSINVTGVGILGEKASDVKKSEEMLKPFMDSIKTLDNYEARLKSVFGDESRIARQFHDSKWRVEWEWAQAQPNDAPALVKKYIDDFRKSVAKDDGKKATRYLSVLQGRPLTEAEIKLAQAIGSRTCRSEI